jgi:hypothetical protein
MKAANIDVLYHIRDTLNVGRVVEVASAETLTVRWIVSSRSDICEVNFSLLNKHGIVFLTPARYWQMDRALNVLSQGIVHFSDLPSINLKAPTGFSITDILAFPWFGDWIGGFTQGKGSFYTDSLTHASWSLYQSHSTLLLEAILAYFYFHLSIV